MRLTLLGMSLATLSLAGPTFAAPPKAAKTVKRPKLAPDKAISVAQRRQYLTALKAARAAQKAGDLAQAVAQFNAAIVAWPDNPQALGERGWARYKQGKLDEAQADLLAALARTSNGNTRGSQLYNLGRVHEAAGRTPAAIAAYRASLTARPHPVVRKRLATLTTAPTGVLSAQPLKPITSLQAFCASVDTELDEGDKPECEKTTSKAGVTVTHDGMTAYVYEHGTGLGERTFHLIFEMPGGQKYAKEAVFTEYNPGAFGIFEEIESMRLFMNEGTLILHTRKQRSDSDMGLNEVEFETSETHTFCGFPAGQTVPRCTDTVLTAYRGAREILHPDEPDDDIKHDLWSTEWKLSVTVAGTAIQIANAGAKLPKGPKSLVGTHTLAW